MVFYDSKSSKFYVAQYDMTSFTTEMTPSTERALREVTVFGDSGSRFFPGTSTDRLSWSGIYDDGAAGSDVVMDAMRQASTAKVVTIWPGDTVVGRPGLGSDEVFLTDQDIPSRVGSRVEMTASLEAGLYDRLKSLGPKSSLVTVTTNGTTIDDAAATSAGGKWIYHIFTWAASGGNARWLIVLEDSANGSSWATVGGGTLNSVPITAVGAARRTFTGAFRRYVRIRVVLDASSGSITFIGGYERD